MTGDFHDIVSGSNGYTAFSGYDLVTGRGTPYAAQVILDLARVSDAFHGYVAGPNQLTALPVPGPSAAQTGGASAAPLNTGGAAEEPSDTSGWHFLANGVRQVSAGRNGVAELVLVNGDAYHFSETTGSFTFLSLGVAQITAGTDENDNVLTDLVPFGGAAYEYRAGSGWSYPGSGVRQVSKAPSGVTDVLFNNGSAYEHGANGWLFPTSGAWAVA
jgi:hypothetical protein